MTHRKWVALFLVTLTTAYVSIPAAHAGGEISNAKRGLAVCEVYVDAEKKKYVSDVMQSPVDLTPARDALAKFIETKYHAKGIASCNGAGAGQMSVAEARAYQKKQYKTARLYGIDLIETGWTFTSTAEARVAFLCIAHASAGPKNVFVRANPVEIPVAAQAELDGAWSAKLKQSHPELYVADQGCSPMAAQDAAARQKSLDYLDHNSVGPGWQIVHVDLKFAPGGKTAPQQQPKAEVVDH